MHCEKGCASWRLRELHRLPAGSLRRLPVALSTLGYKTVAARFDRRGLHDSIVARRKTFRFSLSINECVYCCWRPLSDPLCGSEHPSSTVVVLHERHLAGAFGVSSCDSSM